MYAVSSQVVCARALPPVAHPVRVAPPRPLESVRARRRASLPPAMAELAAAEDAAGILTSTRVYIDRMLNEVTDMKIMLLDTETTGILSMVYTQTQVLQRQVYLVEHMKNTSQHGRMMHLKAIVFVRPTLANVEMLKKELADPHFSQYHLYFSNVIPPDYLSQLAKADIHEVVGSVQEFYADFYAVNVDTFTLNLPSSLALSLPRDMWGGGQERNFDRAADGVIGLLLAQKVKPQIRYAAGSDLAKAFARKVQQSVLSESALFTFRSGAAGAPPPLLLVLDRKDDPITPLLTQWTYQAMVHEMIGINDNRVDMSRAPGIRKDLKEVVLSPSDDTFYTKHMYANFGDLGVAIKELLTRYQHEFKDNQNLSSIDDMQSFIERYPEFRAMSTNVSKHVAVVGELSRLVDQHKMMDVSQLEQELACNEDHAAQFKALQEMLADRTLATVDALRLVMLYALHYETKSGNQLGTLKGLLADRNCDQVGLIDTILRYAGQAQRGGDLYGNKTFMGSIAKLATNLKGVENVYTQHVPYFADTIEQAVKGRLKDSTHPCVSGVATTKPARDVIVFVIGGITYEEAACVARMNKANAGKCNVVLGGTFIHNSKSFLTELSRLKDIQQGYAGSEFGR